MIMGVELAGRIAIAEKMRRRSQGFLPTSLAGSFGAVLTAARLLRLSREQTVNALGINYAQISGSRQALLDASLTKRIQPGFAARSALCSVALAQVGLTGPRRVFEGDAGYFRDYMCGDIPPVEELLQPEKDYLVEYISTKCYPSCGACHPVQVAAERLREDPAFDPNAIERVETFNVAPLVSEPFVVSDHPQVNAQFSAAWGVAHTLLRGPARVSDYTDEAIRADRAVCELAAAITPADEPEDLPPLPEEHPVLTRSPNRYRVRYQGVIVHLRDGRRLMECRAACQAFVPGPAEWPEIEQKFRDCAAFAELAGGQAEALFGRLRAFGVEENVETQTEHPTRCHTGYTA